MKNILLSPDPAEGIPTQKERDADNKSRIALNQPSVRVRAKVRIRRHGVELDTGKEGKISAFAAELLKDSVEKLSLIILLASLLFAANCQAQITNLGFGVAPAVSGTYGLAPSTYTGATNNATNASGGAVASALAYVPSGSNAVFPLTNSIPANSTNWFLGTNGMFGGNTNSSGVLTNNPLPGPYLILNLTKWDQVEIDTAYQMLTNTGAGTGGTNWFFWAPSDDGITFDTNHLITIEDIAFTNNTTAGASGGLFRTNMNTTTTTGDTGYLALVGIGNQGTNTSTNVQVIPIVKSKKAG